MAEDERQKLLVELQSGLPLTARPFAALGERVGVDEDTILATVQSLLQAGQARRLGFVFDAGRLGYQSLLGSIRMDESELPGKLEPLLVHPGVTHCYLRGWPPELPAAAAGDVHPERPNVWFTLSAPRDRFEIEIARLRAAFASHQIHFLPALRRFKIDVILGRQRQAGHSHAPSGADPARLRLAAADAPPSCQPHASFRMPEADRRLLRVLQAGIPAVQRPFDQLAASLGMSVEAMLERLADWQSCGIVRRLAVVLNHLRSGFTANGMCCWPVAEETMLEAAGRVAARPEVTHCYLRPRLPSFPYDLYAMIHTDAWERTLALYQDISAGAGLEGGCVLFSLREFKKASPIFFAEGE